ncbi:DUF6325 family protein [Streptacidiphilus rugosus]|uniref:DUF6325 family protein n=1 Tax=Streptacidiphilus rugosus TaxID=405783 RepID=UPI000566F88B|nr:DUF6325 family protein [Streptacidiphilus rugosus]
MDIGPVEYAVIAFPGNKFKGDIAPELRRLTTEGVVRIIDLTFIKRDVDGTVEILELDALPADEAAAFADVDGEIGGLLSDEDLASICEEIPPDSSAAIIVWENSWAARLTRALREAGGVLVAREQVPASVVAEDLAAIGQ